MLSDRKLRSLYAYPDAGRAWVRTNFVATIDGAAQADNGLSGALGGEPDRRAYATMRTLADVILVGAGTARTEGYGAVQPSDVDQDVRADLGLALTPVVAVATKSLDVPPPLVAPRQIVVTCAASDEAARATLARTMEVIVAGQDEIDWNAVLDAFTARGLTRILCEGGPTLHGTLMALGLVDEVCLTVDPSIVGGPAGRIATGEVATPQTMRLAHAVDEEGVLLTRWVRD